MRLPINMHNRLMRGEKPLCYIVIDTHMGKRLFAEKEITKTDFRKYKEGDVIALFPNDDEGNYKVGSYQHVGQHSPADYQGVIRSTKPALPHEYADLKHELTGHPYHYNVEPRKKFIRRRK